MGVKISSIEFVLANNKLKNSFFKNFFPEYNYDRFEKKVGIKQRFVCGKNENVLSLAEKSAIKLFKKSNIKKEEIDFLILCTQSPTYLIPTNSCILQDRLGLKNSTGSLDFNMGCSGYIYGLSIAKGLIESGQAKKVLLITSETYSQYINKKDLINQLIFSDSSTSTLIESSNTNYLNNFLFGTDGSGFDKLIVKNNFFNKENNPIEKSNFKNNVFTDNNLYMDGTSIFNFALNRIPKLLEDIINQNETSYEKIDFFILHQANKYLLESIRKLSNIESEKFIIDLERYGNTISSSIPIALKNLMINNDSDKNLILCGFGVGLSWGACNLTINKKL